MSSLEETPGPEIVESDKRDIHNVQCWGVPRTRVEKHWPNGNFSKLDLKSNPGALEQTFLIFLKINSQFG